MSPLAPRTLLALAAAADVAPDTVRRRFDGRPMRHSTRARVEAAARKLRVRLPRWAGLGKGAARG